MTCAGCGQAVCRPKFYHLCPKCEGRGCGLCRDSLISGILDGQGGQDEENIRVCSEWGDPEVDAIIKNTMPSLLKALTIAKRDIMRSGGIQP